MIFASLPTLFQADDFLSSRYINDVRAANIAAINVIIIIARTIPPLSTLDKRYIDAANTPMLTATEYIICVIAFIFLAFPNSVSKFFIPAV